MDWDEVRPKTALAVQIGDNLETLSVSELQARIASLQGEIDRVNAELAKKLAHEQAASALFKR